MYIGCHVSIRNGYLDAAKTASLLGANCFQYFPKNPRTLSVKTIDKKNANDCRTFCIENGVKSVAHSPYPSDLTPEKGKKQLVIDSLLNDLEIADLCGSLGVVVHFGTYHNPNDPLEGYKRMIEMMNNILHRWQGKALLLLENNAGMKGEMGITFEEMAQIRNLCQYPDKVGFCLDTCHLFASGVWTGENWSDLEKKGKQLNIFEHLKVIHFNNSKYPSGSRKDRHANIKRGHIGLNQFNALVYSSYLKELPFILETPNELGYTHGEEIRDIKTFFM
ncbi:deoxyribonuclease IV [Bacillus sp. Marseille-P3661]|uniref:deoxyribonuclease IV n=1 Tax=Bacillus sp. Marseille-P3661 TaxID=1936234 RepID=UPI0015E1664E|nr:deoxyribonuclease IV [Bacillus sp. Marseille-P3661]